MPPAHRKDDLRECAATTVVVGQSSVEVNGKLWAVDRDPNSHGAGELIPSGSSVTINGKRVIVHRPDTAEIDNFFHITPLTDTAQGSGNVSAYG